MIKVLLAFKNPKTDCPTACHAGMGVTAMNTALALREARIAADPRPVANGEYLWARLANEWSGYTHVILCAPYIDACFLGKLVRQYPTKQFVVVYHSNLGFLSVDRFAARSLPQFLALEETAPNFQVAANSNELAAAITESTGEPMTFLPNLYHLPHMTRRTRSRWQPGMDLHIGLFGAARVLKNWLTAVAAAMILQRRLASPVYLHLSSGRDEHVESMRHSLVDLAGLNPNLTLVDAPWMAVDDFRRYLYGMDLLLQPSFTETFNNVTADGAACGVPSVVSEAIDWVPPAWIAKADSAVDIATVGVRVLNDRKAPQRGWEALERYNVASLRQWREWIRA